MSLQFCVPPMADSKMFCPQKDRAANGCNSQAACLHVCLHLSWLTQRCAWLILFVLSVAYGLRLSSLSSNLVCFILRMGSECPLPVPLPTMTRSHRAKRAPLTSPPTRCRIYPKVLPLFTRLSSVYQVHRRLQQPQHLLLPLVLLRFGSNC